MSTQHKVNQEETVYLSFDARDRTAVEAIRILRNAGFSVRTSPTAGLPEPELSIGVDDYRGLDEIRRFAEESKLGKVPR